MKFFIFLFLLAAAGLIALNLFDRDIEEYRRGVSSPDAPKGAVDTMVGGAHIRNLQRAKNMAVTADFAVYQVAFTQYYLLYNKYPDSLAQLVEKGYINHAAQTDPWGQELRFEITDDQIIMTSPGQDRIKNTKDDLSMTIPLN